MSNYEIFVIGSQDQYEEMVKLGEYQKSCLKDVYPNSVITVAIAETGCEPDMKEARDINEEREIPSRQKRRVIKKNLKNISKSNLVLALEKEDGGFDMSTTYLMAFAEFLGKCLIPVKANSF